MIYERIRRLCKARGTTVNKLEKELGFARGHMRKWQTIGPTVDKISLVARYFGVSIDYLVSEEKEPFGMDEPKEPISLGSVGQH